MKLIAITTLVILGPVAQAQFTSFNTSFHSSPSQIYNDPNNPATGYTIEITNPMKNGILIMSKGTDSEQNRNAGQRFCERAFGGSYVKSKGNNGEKHTGLMIFQDNSLTPTNSATKENHIEYLTCENATSRTKLPNNADLTAANIQADNPQFPMYYPDLTMTVDGEPLQILASSEQNANAIGQAACRAFNPRSNLYMNMVDMGSVAVFTNGVASRQKSILQGVVCK